MQLNIDVKKKLKETPPKFRHNEADSGKKLLSRILLDQIDAILVLKIGIGLIDDQRARQL